MLYKVLFCTVLLHILSSPGGSCVTAANPAIRIRYTADPSAHVFPGDDRVWLYCSHDHDDATTFDSMSEYYVYSSTDLVEWQDYGLALHLDNVTWAKERMWAPDGVKWKGKYYLVFCACDATGEFKTGLAVSDVPQGPFVDIGYIEGAMWGQDPALFVDDDDAAYLVWGCGGGIAMAQLNDDLLSIKQETLVNLTSQLPQFYEGPWLHKYNGVYYLSYPTIDKERFNDGERLEYATSLHPLGPYTPRGVVMDRIPDLWTQHGSIIEFRNQWYLFYHTADLSGDHLRRSVAIERLEYEADGSIRTITPTKEGVGPVAPLTPQEAALQELRHAWRRQEFTSHKAALQGHLHQWRQQRGSTLEHQHHTSVNL